MKWLVIQSDGEHKGQDAWNPNWYLRECYSIQRALQAYGHQADVWGLRHRNFTNTPNFESYDGLFIAENYGRDWLPDFSKIRHPLKIHWLVDLHYQGPAAYVDISRQCDVVLHATRSLMKDYQQRCPLQKHIWFPNAVDDYYFDKSLYLPRTRRHNFVFVGSKAGRRAEVIGYLEHSRLHKLECFYGCTGKDYIDLLLSSKVQFNMGINCDVNYRTFETIALGCCLCTEKHDDLRDLGFVDRKNCLIFDDPTLVEAAIGPLYFEGRLEAIAEAGYQLSKTHTYKLRVRDALNEILRSC